MYKRREWQITAEDKRGRKRKLMIYKNKKGKEEYVNIRVIMYSVR